MGSNGLTRCFIVLETRLDRHLARLAGLVSNSLMKYFVFMHFSGPCNCCQLLMACLRETLHDFFMHILYYFRRFAGLLNHPIHRMQRWFSPYFKAIISFAIISTKYNYNRKCIGRLHLIIARYISYIFNSNSNFFIHWK